MGTIILSAVGSKFNRFWGAAGALAGAWIDQKYLYPKLFPTLPEHPKMGDFELQSANEGTPINTCFGPENRVTGTVIWISDIREVEKTEEVGGKGGGSQAVTSYVYYVDVAIAVCFGEIQSISKIWADGKVLYDADPDVSVDDATDLAVERVVEYSGIGGYSIIMKVTSSTTDLSEFKSGVDVLTSGFSNGGNNGTFRCKNSSLRTLELQNNSCVTEVAGATVDLFQDLPTLDLTKADEMTVYVGSNTQDPDDLIESVEGTSPAFRGIAYIVLEGLALQDFGNRLPQFQFLVEKDATKTVASTIEDILQLAGLSSSEYDTSGVTGNLRGYTIAGITSPKDALNPIMEAFDIIVRESNGKLYFTHRLDTGQQNITETDLAAHESGSEAPKAVTITDGSDNKLPKEVNIQFIEANLDYQKASQKEVKNEAISDTIFSVDIPIVLDATTARGIARRKLWVSWATRQSLTFSLPPSYYWIEESDRLLVPSAGENYNVRVKKVTRGHDYIILIEGVVEQVLVTASGVAEETSIIVPGIYIPPELTSEIIDIAPLSDAAVSLVGFYVAVCAADIEAQFLGAVLYESSDDVNYSSKGIIPSESVVGVTDGTLGDSTAWHWDRINTIQVTISHGSLSSKTELEVLNGQNWAVLGNEIIAFQTATLIDTNKYELSMLLRGLRGTEDETDSHNANERFVLLSENTLSFKTHSSGLIGSAKYYKDVPSGGVLTDYTGAQHTHTGGTIRPFAVCHVQGVRDSSDNLVISWVRRTRYLVDPINQYTAPLEESVEEYQIDIYDAGWTTVLRTITITSATTTTYTAAQQTTDFGAPQSSVNMKIYQMSDIMGRGRPREETL